MSVQIQPQQQFAIVRQLPDPGDSTQYYVRAEIRNAQTDAIINVGGNAYLNLTSRGSQRYSASFQAPADVSGKGLLICVKSTVYTDSGYTTKSTTYGEEMETYLVMERFNPREMLKLMGPAWGSDSADIDYKKIRAIFEEVLAAKLKPVMENLKEMYDYAEECENKGMEGMASMRMMIGNGIMDVKQTIKGIEVKPNIPLDGIRAEIKNGITTIFNKLEKLEGTESEVTKNDLAPIMQVLERLEKNNYNEDMKTALNDSLSKLKDLVAGKLPEVDDILKEMVNKFRDLSTYMIMINTMPQPNKKPDFTQRAKELAENIDTD